MSFRHLVLGLLSTTLVASTLSVQAAAPTPAKTDRPAASDVVKSIVGGSKATPATRPAATVASPAAGTRPSYDSAQRPAISTKAAPSAGATRTSAEDADDDNGYKAGPSLPTSKYSARASAVDPYSWGVTASVLTGLRQASKLQTAKGAKVTVAKNNKAAESMMLAMLAKEDGSDEKPNLANQALLNRALAKFYLNSKNNQGALAYANRLVQIDKERFGEKNLFVAEDMKLLGDLYTADEAYDDASKTYQKALKMANKSPDSQYCPNIKYAAANKNRKQILISSLYDGLAVANFQPPDPDDDDDGTAAANADAYFTKAAREILKSSDYVDKYNRANLLFSRYKQYLKNSDQKDKAAKAEDQIEDYERRIQADREYRIQQSTKL
jgi:hypothetical protein